MKLLVGLFLYSSFSLFADDGSFCSVPDLSAFLPEVNLPIVPEEDLIEIKKNNFKRNKNASFCTRPLDMIDTIVIHHSDTGPTNTADDMNTYHLNRVSYKTNDAGAFIRDSRGRKIKDPWYMVGYSYIVNSAYAGSLQPKPLVTEGRPLEIVGSHAGSSAFTKMDDDQKRMWETGKVQCGKEGGPFKVDQNQSSDGNIKANISSIGVVVIGNYAIKSSANPGGYPPSKPRDPTLQTVDMLARLACQLQKKNPRMKSIKWHSSYTKTICPGNLKNHVDQMKSLAKGYGCEFN
jgi:hypothetical protein